MFISQKESKPHASDTRADPSPAKDRLYAFELLAAVTFLVALFSLRLFGLGITWWTVSFTFQTSAGLILGYLLVGSVWQLLYLKLRRQPVGEYLNAIRKPSWLLLLLRIMIAGLLMFYSYIWLKLAVPLINWRLYDDQFWDIDQMIHGGISPNLFFTGLFTNSYFLRFLDSAYSMWFYVILAGQGFFSASIDNAFRARFLFSVIAIWMVGVWLYIAFPALGPVYHWQQIFSGARASMPDSVATQDTLWRNYQKVLESKKNGRIRAPFNPAFGIAAMPSLHVGMMVLLFLWSRKSHRAMSLFFAIMSFLILFASILSGWHYAIDGYVGALIAYLSYRAALLTG